MPATTWSIDRKISVTLILAGLTTTFSLVWFLVNQDKRTTVVEQVQEHHIASQREVDSRQDTERVEMRKQMREDYNNINHKLDRIMERLAK